MITPVVLPWPLHSSLEAATRRCLIQATGLPSISRDLPARPRLCRPARSRGACSRTRFRFSSAASLLSQKPAGRRATVDG